MRSQSHLSSYEMRSQSHLSRMCEMRSQLHLSSLCDLNRTKPNNQLVLQCMQKCILSTDGLQRSIIPSIICVWECMCVKTHVCGNTSLSWSLTDYWLQLYYLRWKIHAGLPAYNKTTYISNHHLIKCAIKHISLRDGLQYIYWSSTKVCSCSWEHMIEETHACNKCTWAKHDLIIYLSLNWSIGCTCIKVYWFLFFDWLGV